MANIIKLLPEHVVNKIAAGEVIQRPSSAVKELIENSIDAGSTIIKLIIKDAGKTLIQVIDNGCGMEDTDARLCFERHATSKIRDDKDLYTIRTMGFRGEALASIAAIAQVELKTKRKENEIGTLIQIEGSNFIKQEPCICPDGTSITIKNLFYNVPARRQFLKNDNVEYRHILEEFQKLAIANPDIEFTLIQNEKTVIKLEKSLLKTRLMGIFGNNYAQRLIPAEQKTNIASISGFIGKPEYAKKTKGEQYFFVNNRYIRNAYLNYAVADAYNELIPEKYVPSYFLFIEIDPSLIDVNVHPTKTEIKFKEEKIIYTLIKTTVRHSLGKFNLTPSIDFDIQKPFDLPPLETNIDNINPPKIIIKPEYNPFDKQVNYSQQELKQNNLKNWEKLFSSTPIENQVDLKNFLELEKETETTNIIEQKDNETIDITNKLIFQFQKRYILTNVKSGFMIIDIQRAHERILFEKYLENLNNGEIASQTQLFPKTVQLNHTDSQILENIIDELKILGFDINMLGPRTFVINGIPANIKSSDNIESFIEDFIENYKNLDEAKNNNNIRIALSMAKSACSKLNRKLPKEEILSIIDELFACKVPEISPSGKNILTIINFDDLIKKLK
ncbi:MAG TPA: DNA mismatch repair endonuclease MutL [Bacteroidales bacterium]|nr:DNA mismatch repair endonuclease MutL [Bacteroidales bacterium]